jgi:hypothetical protein
MASDGMKLELEIDTSKAEKLLAAVVEAARAQFAICRAGDVVFIEYDRAMTVEVHDRLQTALFKSLEGTDVRVVVLSKGMRVGRIQLVDPEKQ